MVFLKKTLSILLGFIRAFTVLTIVALSIAVAILACGKYEIGVNTGDSMLPTIDRNYTILIPVTSETDLSVGDIVHYSAYKSSQPILIGHRIVIVGNDQLWFVLKGDNNDGVDTPRRMDTGNYTDQIPGNLIKYKTVMIIPHAFDPLVNIVMKVRKDDLAGIYIFLLGICLSSWGAHVLVGFIPTKPEGVKMPE